MKKGWNIKKEANNFLKTFQDLAQTQEKGHTYTHFHSRASAAWRKEQPSWAVLCSLAEQMQRKSEPRPDKGGHTAEDPHLQFGIPKSYPLRCQEPELNQAPQMVAKLEFTWMSVLQQSHPASCTALCPQETPLLPSHSKVHGDPAASEPHWHWRN